MPESTTPRWRALGVCVGALFMTLLDVTVTNVALPAIGNATNAAPAELQWVVSGYALAFGLVPIIAGRLGDDHGRRRMFIIGVAGFVVTSAMAGLSPGPGLLIGARVLQGLAGGLINPQVSGLVQQMFTGADRGRAFGAIGTVVGVATAVGPLVGGALIALGGPTLGWRLVFFVNVPVGIVIVFLARRWLPPPRTDGRRHRLDLPGAVLLGLATLCVLVAAVEYDALQDLRLLWLAVPAALLLAIFVRRELRLTRARQDPLVDLRLFTRPSYSVGVGLALLYFAGATGLPLVLALYYQRGLGYTALESGLGHHGLRPGVGHCGAARRTRGHPDRPPARRRRPDHLRSRRPGDRPDGPARARGAHRTVARATVVHPRPGRGRRHHPEPDAVLDGRRCSDGQHRRGRPADVPADRLSRRSGGHRSILLCRAHRPGRDIQWRRERRAPRGVRPGLCRTPSSSP